MKNSINAKYIYIYWPNFMPQLLTMRVMLYHVNPTTCHVPRFWSNCAGTHCAFVKEQILFKRQQKSTEAKIQQAKIGSLIFTLLPMDYFSTRVALALRMKMFSSYNTFLVFYSPFLKHTWVEQYCLCWKIQS